MQDIDKVEQITWKLDRSSLSLSCTIAIELFVVVAIGKINYS